MQTRKDSTWKDVIAKTEDYFGFLSSLSGVVQTKAVAEVHVRLQMLIENVKKQKLVTSLPEERDEDDKQTTKFSKESDAKPSKGYDNKTPKRSKRTPKTSPRTEQTAAVSSPPPQKFTKTYSKRKAVKGESPKSITSDTSSTSKLLENIKSDAVAVKTEPNPVDITPPSTVFVSEDDSDNAPEMDLAGSSSSLKKEDEKSDVNPDKTPVKTPDVTPGPVKRGRGRPKSSQKKSEPIVRQRRESKKVKSEKSDEIPVDEKPMKSPDPVVKRVGRPRKEYTLIGEKQTPRTKKESMFTCEVCGKELSKETTLADHMRVHTGDLIPCEKCDKKFLSRNSLYMHMRDHSERKFYRCQRCQYSSLSQDLLDDHIQSKHGPDRPRVICEVCGKTFCRPNSLTEHMRIHSQVKYNCEMCDYTTHSPGILRIHIHNKHTDDKQTYTCKLCGATLRYKGSYQAHMRSHFGRKPFQCDICGNCFTSQTQRASHKLTHFAASYPCPECGKKFRDKHKVTRHMVIHTGEKSFQCHVCSYRCNLRHNLQKHCKNVHGILTSQRTVIEKVMSDSELANVESITIVPEGEEDASETVYIGKAGQILGKTLIEPAESGELENTDNKPDCKPDTPLESGGLRNINIIKTAKSKVTNYPAMTDYLVPEVIAAPKTDPEAEQVVMTTSDLTGILSEPLSKPSLIKLESSGSMPFKCQPQTTGESLIPSVVDEVQESSIQYEESSMQVQEVAVSSAGDFQQHPVDISEHMYAMKSNTDENIVIVHTLDHTPGGVAHTQGGATPCQLDDNVVIVQTLDLPTQEASAVIGALNNTSLGAMETVTSDIPVDVLKLE